MTTIAMRDQQLLDTAIVSSWSKIAPYWPLQNLIAVNPLAGFEHLPFEQALQQAHGYFQQRDLAAEMQTVNRHSIKWLQAFFDQGQAAISMPYRERGLLASLRLMITLDASLHRHDAEKLQWLGALSEHADEVIAEALEFLAIPVTEHGQFLTLMLTTLPGWASYVRYRTHWADSHDSGHPHQVNAAEYLAFRLILTCLVWPQAKQLLATHEQAVSSAELPSAYTTMLAREQAYRVALLTQLKGAGSAHQHAPQHSRYAAQLVFCIDVRSEPLRRAIEQQGNYQTFGFAGFFGLPVAIENAVTGASHASCPVLLKPNHKVVESPVGSLQNCRKAHQRGQTLKKLYQSLKYNFTTPFVLADAMGVGHGVWMGLRSLVPATAGALTTRVQSALGQHQQLHPNSAVIALPQRINYAASALRMMGLTEQFAPWVVLCGHGSTTTNNIHATALDCGACGGRHGAPNARILAAILNDGEVRAGLAAEGIEIPSDTTFVAAEHNTTTDQVELFSSPANSQQQAQLAVIKRDLRKASEQNSDWRAAQLGLTARGAEAHRATALRAQHWAEVRPEWGLARNAAFIVGPRAWTQDIDLDGRAFLHSYEWQSDGDGSALTTILTAPMVVGQWINAHYLFATLDNVAFGGGSKVTANITGKIGVMQGNGSDLMHGLPLQSVYASDQQSYHEPMRLLVVVRAPQARLNAIIAQQPILQKLFGNGWITMVCCDPQLQQYFTLQRDLTWCATD
ncbi:DUF2309 domain-containing protein [Pseudidiomarina mangrovi]|uniref:DUF2309 domain-containing protein n=1 Tax=Pseudidiomarina mangrovi TaxID=2487133 RepID=UPI00196B842F|nr:DUF2309 domain-containing protein [Pseudidiomarina mangrovi]